MYYNFEILYYSVKCENSVKTVKLQKNLLKFKKLVIFRSDDDKTEFVFDAMIVKAMIREQKIRFQCEFAILAGKETSILVDFSYFNFQKLRIS